MGDSATDLTGGKSEDITPREQAEENENPPLDLCSEVDQQVVANDSQEQIANENLPRETKDDFEIGSSVDPDQDILISLAKADTVNIENETDKHEVDEVKSQEGDTFTDITPDDSLCENDLDIDIKDEERNDSETSDLIFTESILDVSVTNNNTQQKEESVSETQEKELITLSEPSDAGIKGEDMPEKREGEVVSPTLQRANLRFRWAKTISVSANEVILFSSHKREDPIKLTWSEGADCFYSKDMEVPTGIYKGTIVIDDKSYPIEEVTVKHYTFEADLYIKDDIIEDNFNVGRAVNPGNVDPDENKSNPDQLNYSAKIEDIIRQQMTSADNKQEVAPNHGSGRHTPIGDVARDVYQDGMSSLNNSYTKNSNTSLVEDEIEQSFHGSYHSSNTHTPQPSVEEIIENTLQRSGSKGDITPDRRTPVDRIINSDNLDDGFGFKSPSGTYSVHSSARHTPQKDYGSDILDYENLNTDDVPYAQTRTPTKSEEGSRHASARHTPLDDVLEKSSTIESFHGSSNHTPLKMSGHSSARQTPQLMSDSLQASQEKMYGSHGSLPSLHNSLPAYAGSRPQSLTSEQELTQYFEQSSRKLNDHTSVGSKKTPTPQHQFIATTQSSGSRPQSTSSLPVITTQQRLLAEKRSMTPDNYIRVPGSTSAPVARPSSVSRIDAMSCSSSRTITPAHGDDTQFNVGIESIKRIEDLEDTVRNLRKLLSAREQEVHELTDQLNDVKDSNRSLHDQVQHCQQKHSGTPRNEGLKELERRSNLLAEEKEILAQEVIKLKDQINDLQHQVDRRDHPEGEAHPSLSSYDPNNPNALQRKIADLQSHVQDLHEANESAASELDKAERKISDLIRQNESLQKSQNVSQHDLQAENRQLHDKISKLWEQGYGSADHNIRVENQQLRDDNRATRERNYKLHEENLKLKEELTDLRKVLERQVSEPKFSRSSPDLYDKYASPDRSKLPDISVEKLNRTSVAMVNGHTSIEQKPVIEKEGHRYGYRQNKEDKLYSNISERDMFKLHSSVDMPGSTNSLEKSNAYLRSPIEKDSYRRFNSQELKLHVNNHGKDERFTRESDYKDKSPFRSSLQKAEAKLRSSLEKNSYLDRYSTYESKDLTRNKIDTSEKLRIERSKTPERLDTYRSMPDGISDKEEQRYTLSSEDRQSRSLASREYKAMTSSYPDLNRITASPMDKGISQTQPLHSTEPYLLYNEMSRYRSTIPHTRGHMAYTTQDYYGRDYDYYRADKKSSAYPNDGYESDTGTDILVSAQPYEQRITPTSSPEDSPNRHPKYHQRSYSQRRDSLGSDGSSIEDVEESFNKLRFHSRSKSADGRELLRRTEPMGGSGRTPQKTDRLTTGVPGFRTVTPSVLHTQHNRTIERGPLTTLTSGMRPFAPRTPGDINLEDVVKFSRQGGKLSQGKVKFVGHLPGRSDIYLGVELDKEDGKHDGTFEGVRYYQCKASKGVFVAFNKVVMAWAPNTVI